MPDMSDEPTVTIETGPRKGDVLTGRRARRYLTDPAYRAHYDTQPAPAPAPRTAVAAVPMLPQTGRGPSFVQKVRNLGRDGMKHLMDQGRKVPKEVYEIRLEVCKGCPLYKDNRCTHPRCGCQMASSSKMTGALWWASKECPDSPPRWLRWTSEDQQKYEELKREQAQAQSQVLPLKERSS